MGRGKIKTIAKVVPDACVSIHYLHQHVVNPSELLPINNFIPIKSFSSNFAVGELSEPRVAAVFPAPLCIQSME